MDVLSMNKPSKNQALYERNMELQKAYALITELEGRVKELEAKQGWCSVHGQCPNCRAIEFIGDPRIGVTGMSYPPSGETKHVP